jgi:hypothetical protein
MYGNSGWHFRCNSALGGELILTHILTEVPLYGEEILNIEVARKVRDGARTWAEIEINPLTAGPAGAVAVDARARLSR